MIWPGTVKCNIKVVKGTSDDVGDIIGVREYGPTVAGVRTGVRTCVRVTGVHIGVVAGVTAGDRTGVRDAAASAK